MTTVCADPKLFILNIHTIPVYLEATSPPAIPWARLVIVQAPNLICALVVLNEVYLDTYKKNPLPLPLAGLHRLGHVRATFHPH